MDDRFNTIAGWVLFAGIVALGSSIVAGEIFHSERPEKGGYPIEGVVQEGEGAAAPEQPIEFFLAKADPAKGQQVFNKCAACHNADKGGANQLGPNLWGVLGEPVGQGRGFPFSDALAKKGGNWNWDNLGAMAEQPQGVRAGHQDDLRGLSNPQDRADVIAFLNAHSDAPKPLPAAPAAAAAPPPPSRARARQRPAEGREGAGPRTNAGTCRRPTGRSEQSAAK